MIQLNDGQCWLYAAADLDTSELPHASLEPTTNKKIAQKPSLNSVRNTRFLRHQYSLMAHAHYELYAIEQATISDMKDVKIDMSSNMFFVGQKDELSSSRIASATPQ